MISRTLLTLAASAVLAPGVLFADAAGSALAAKLDKIQEGTALVRLRMATGGDTYQLQIKERRTAGSAHVLYQVLWPTEKKGSSVLLRRSGDGAPSGHVFDVPATVTPLGAGDLDGALFGSDLAYADIIENFFAWENQQVVGAEAIGGRQTQVLESKPGSDQWSNYGSVRSWIDPGRLVPLRVEKFDKSGNLVRRIDTTRVHKNDDGEYIPASLTVRKTGSGAATELEGSRSRTGVTFDDDAFTVPKMADLTTPER